MRVDAKKQNVKQDREGHDNVEKQELMSTASAAVSGKELEPDECKGTRRRQNREEQEFAVIVHVFHWLVHR